MENLVVMGLEVVWFIFFLLPKLLTYTKACNFIIKIKRKYFLIAQFLGVGSVGFFGGGRCLNLNVKPKK